jgi:hypothetical protein
MNQLRQRHIVNIVRAQYLSGFQSLMSSWGRVQAFHSFPQEFPNLMLSFEVSFCLCRSLRTKLTSAHPFRNLSSDGIQMCFLMHTNGIGWYLRVSMLR